MMKQRETATTVRQALFDPSVVIPRSRMYWLSAAILIAVGLLISSLPYLLMVRADDFGAIMQASMLSILSYVLIYPWFCLLGGRLRDAAIHPAWFIAFLIGWSLLSSIGGGLAMVVAMVSDSSALAEVTESLEAQTQSAGSDIGSVMDTQFGLMSDMMRLTFWPMQIASILSSLLIVGLAALFPPRADDNPHRWKRTYVPPTPVDPAASTVGPNNTSN